MKRKNLIWNSTFDRLRPLAVIAVSSLFLLLFSVAISVLTSRWLYLPIGSVIIVVQIVVFWVAATLSSKRKRADTEKLSLLNGMTLDFLTEMNVPVAIFSEEGLVLWYNNAFLMANGNQSALYHENIQDLCDEKLNLRRLRTESPEELAERPVIGSLKGEAYEVVSYKIASEGKNLLITLWQSLARVQELETELAEKNPVVSYIAVDNYTEAAAMLQGNYRTITAKISIMLKDWAAGLGGILREVGSDRYILIIEEKRLKELTDKKFDILDDVREISTDNVDVPITISIGTACTDGTLLEKETAAHQALDLALQRGGDQAVLKKRENATEYYGGRTKTVQKRTKIRSRIVASEAMNLMSAASNVLIMGHRFADHDSIGSSIGMARFAMQYCPKVNIVVNVHDTNLKGVFHKLSGLEDYKNMFIDGATAQDLITSTTLLIITDVNNVRQFEAPELFENCSNVVIIDHHRQSAEFAVKPKITYIEPSASSASELVCEMLEQQLPPGSLLKEEAELLFAGMILDTKQFANNTGPRTFAAAHFLRSEGANPAEAQMLFRSGLEDFKREIKYEANAFIYREIIAFSYIEENATQEDKIAASKAADRLLSLEGILASFVLCRIDRTVHISARSSGTVNVQLITEKLHGGGHFDMAGAQVKDATIKETFVQLKAAIDEYLNEA
ncbi:MAG: DHH family phosphoesterase [Clostridia bacterium]|nr:DHH family phosphoesterase [Clostridia bacterium]